MRNQLLQRLTMALYVWVVLSTLQAEAAYQAPLTPGQALTVLLQQARIQLFQMLRQHMAATTYSRYQKMVVHQHQFLQQYL